MGCRKLAYYNETERPNLRDDQPLPALKVVGSKKRLTPRSSAEDLRSNNLYRYNGKEKDGESGLYNYGMRYYAPWMCRFVSVDPLAAEYPHYTPYQYAGNKPINKVDRDGLEEEGGATAPTGGGGPAQVPDALQVSTPNVSLLPKPKLHTATIGSVIVNHQGKEPVVLGSTDEIYGLLGVTRQGPFVEVISEILANDLLRENGTITFSDLGPEQGGPVNSGGPNQSLDSPIGVRFGVTFQGFDEQGGAADLYTEISVPVASIHHGSVSDVLFAVLVGRLTWSSKVPSASRNAAVAVQEAKVVEEAVALQAPKQVAANWGINTYKHGGEMFAIEHIMYRHGPNSGFSNVSRFAEGVGSKEIKGMVDDAFRYGIETAGKGSSTFEYNLDRTIGTNSGGGAANGIRVHIRNGNVQTAFPITIP